MLVLSRKIGERINIGDGITVTVLAVQGRRVRLGITAPEALAIWRSEVPWSPTPPGEPDAELVASVREQASSA
jgi:carbon storage regulator